jgi:hypothetical protein
MHAHIPTLIKADKVFVAVRIKLEASHFTLQLVSNTLVLFPIAFPKYYTSELDILSNHNLINRKHTEYVKLQYTIFNTHIHNNPCKESVGTKDGILICLNILFKLRICKVCTGKNRILPCTRKQALPGSSRVVKFKILTFHCSANNTLKTRVQAFSVNEFLSHAKKNTI